MSKFTAGPWVYDDRNGEVIIDGVCVLRFDDCDIDGKESTGRANCALIAAAPELYEALEAALKTVESEKHPFRAWHQDAKEALAKARGE